MIKIHKNGSKLSFSIQYSDLLQSPTKKYINKYYKSKNIPKITQNWLKIHPQVDGWRRNYHCRHRIECQPNNAWNKVYLVDSLFTFYTIRKLDYDAHCIFRTYKRACHGMAEVLARVHNKCHIPFFFHDGAVAILDQNNEYLIRKNKKLTSTWRESLSICSLYCGNAWTIFCKSLVEISPPSLYKKWFLR